MECEKCKSKRLRVIDAIETPILEKSENVDYLDVFIIRCKECKHEFKKKYKI